MRLYPRGRRKLSVYMKYIVSSRDYRKIHLKTTVLRQITYVNESPDSEIDKNTAFIDYSKKKNLIRKTGTVPSHYMSKIPLAFIRLAKF